MNKQKHIALYAGIASLLVSYSSAVLADPSSGALNPFRPKAAAAAAAEKASSNKNLPPQTPPGPAQNPGMPGMPTAGGPPTAGGMPGMPAAPGMPGAVAAPKLLGMINGVGAYKTESGYIFDAGPAAATSLVTPPAPIALPIPR